MSKRFFHTDPLAAAWMAKHFGMRFITHDLTRERIVLPLVDADREGDRYYIHPDSLHLLGPNLGDLIWSPRLIGHVTAIGPDRVLVEIGAAPIQASQIDVRDITLVQRNRVAFMWPECEE